MRSCPLWFPCREWGKQSARASWCGPLGSRGPRECERDRARVAANAAWAVGVDEPRADRPARVIAETDPQLVVVLDPLTRARTTRLRRAAVYRIAVLHEAGLA